MKSRRDWVTVHVDMDDGMEAALQVKVQFCPAEPDVGIMHPYIEIDEVQDMLDKTLGLSDSEQMRVQAAVESEVCHDDY